MDNIIVEQLRPMSPKALLSGWITATRGNNGGMNVRHKIVRCRGSFLVFGKSKPENQPHKLLMLSGLLKYQEKNGRKLLIVYRLARLIDFGRWNA